PVWGIIGDLTAVFSRKPAFWYRGQVYAMAAVTSLSGLVYGHHLFLAGIGPVLGKSFEALTLGISAPAVILYVCWLCTLSRGSIRRDVPMLFVLGALVVFGLGGLSGLFLGAVTTDIYLHDSMWVVGHFHLIMAASTFLGAFAAIYYWFPKIFGRCLGVGLGRLHFWGSLVLLVVAFSLMLAGGYAGLPRRLYDPYQYAMFAHLRGLNQIITWAVFGLAAIQLAFVVNLILTLARKADASANPWDATTLEWTLPSPVPATGFADAPVVMRGPHEHSHPDVVKTLGRDFLTQSEAWAGAQRAPDEARNLAPGDGAGRVGAGVALASLAMAVLAMFFSYGVLRAQSGAWAMVPVPAVDGTLAAFAIGLVIVATALALARRLRGALALAASAACALGATVMAIVSWPALFGNGIDPGASPHASMVALLLVVAGAMAALMAAVYGVLCGRARLGRPRAPGWLALCHVAAAVVIASWLAVWW
ncbi:MAG TPA: cbb3-type cytochrome c oxidase subunit I, partial [Kofleriaceae bacterium]|nr:cbb3-type cytochrome c oxidase subunit I [Kofleriaceae bacterium]